jgi:DNA polymerase delta subunit 3
MDKYKEYLAVQVLNESQIVRSMGESNDIYSLVLQVSHRQLSRALKVHNQLAKQYVLYSPFWLASLTKCTRMLYDFHKSQNAKKPNSVHATYLLTGTARTEPTESARKTQTQEDEDSIMQSSPFPSSYPEPEPPLEFEDEDVEPVEENIPTTIVTLVREEDLEGTFSYVRCNKLLTNAMQRRKKSSMRSPTSVYTAYSPEHHRISTS